MATLFGTTRTRAEIESRTGDILQVGGIRLMELSDGAEHGVRIADVRTGSGLRFQVSLDRGMDISLAEYKGIPLAWRSPAGDVHPSFFDPRGAGWGRTFPGGLMTGCGLTAVGAPCVDEGEELGLHGRVSHIPAYDVSSSHEWQGDECTFRLEGNVRQTAMFKENLLLHRRLEFALGEPRFTFHDTVTNEGTERSPLMVLYHVNLGWPLVSEHARLYLNAKASIPRDPAAAAGLAEARSLSRPIPAYKEQVFYHDLAAEKDGFATAFLASSEVNLGCYVRYRQKELPRYTEWKMVGQGVYVVGMEPANCWVEGRAEERRKGTLQFIEPGERREFVVSLGVVEGTAEIGRFIREHGLVS